MCVCVCVCVDRSGGGYGGSERVVAVRGSLLSSWLMWRGGKELGI